ncbi:hypothetical protein PVAP13_5KG470900 [Panicum virgatum]|uniref:Uncharacterized protein n=1 Tax=Panicum virgatum TaxID=38727 RepID=A0A8T0SNU8_PANVG|nr:hypothetical protein PVAP13_5KG470900 [Panicum virgatum]
MGRKLGLDRVLDCFSLSLCANGCACVHSVEKDEDEADERKALVSSQLEELVKLRDFVDGAAKTLAFHLEPKWSSRCPCTATDAPRKSRSTSPRWTV